MNNNHIKFNKKDIVDTYLNNNLTLHQLREIFKCSRKYIRDTLKEFDVIVSKRNKLTKLSEQHKLKISIANKGKSRTCKCKRTGIINRMCRNGLSFKYINTFPDLNKLIFLSRIISRHKKKWFETPSKVQEYFDKFYHDSVFNNLYDNWIIHNRNKQFRPTIEHINPLSKGGGWELDNLTFLTWFENKLKYNMTSEEWCIFKKHTQTTSNLFI